MSKTSKHRPGCSSRLKWLTGLLALTQVGAVVQAARVPADLAAQVSLLLPLEFVAAALWALVFALVTVAQFRRRPGALRSTVWALAAFLVYNLVRWLVFARADYDRDRLPFLLVSSLVLIILIAFLTRSYTNAKHKT